MKEIKAPNKIPQGRSIFLAGSIEMGAAENWQDRVARELASTDWILLNPRRDDWDSSWKQSIENKQFREQVEWELNAMEHANHILMYFDPATKSPISLLELGLWTHPSETKASKLIVVCPEGFWRKGNVDVVCSRYRVPQFLSLDSAIRYFRDDF